jgi:hypothetical protein
MILALYSAHVFRLMRHKHRLVRCFVFEGSDAGSRPNHA